MSLTTIFGYYVFKKMFSLYFSPLNSRSSTNVSRQSTQDYSDPDLLYEDGSHSHMPSPARARWIDAFNKVCAQFNGVCIVSVSFAHKISNTDISKYLLYQRIEFEDSSCFYFQVLISQTTDISK